MWTASCGDDLAKATAALDNDHATVPNGVVDKWKAALLAVKKALREQEKNQTVSRPLKRFGIELPVIIHHHKKEKGERVVRRTMAVMKDNLTWKKMTGPKGWFEEALGLKEGRGAKLSVQYMNRRGRGVPIKKQTDLQGCTPGEAWGL